MTPNNIANIFNADNQIDMNGYGYDGNGNATTHADNTYGYDVENRLTNISASSFSSAYGPDDLRVKKTVGSTTTYYLTDTDDLPVDEETYNGTASLSLIHAAGADGEHEAYTPGLLSRLFAFDPEENVVWKCNNGNNTTVGNALLVYDSYGDLLLNQTPSRITLSADTVGFHGQWGAYTDKDVTLGTSVTGSPIYSTLMTHRYYDPRTGRFINRDPIGYNGGINLYGYAGGNPIIGSDISGLSDKKEWWEIIGEFLGIYKHITHLNGQPSIGAGHGNIGLSKDEKSDLSLLDRDPKAAAKELNAGVINSLSWGLSLIPIPGAQTEEALVGAEQVVVVEFDIVKYKTVVGGGFEKHHGVLDIWARANILNYAKGEAPAIVLTAAQHNATRSEFLKWRFEQTGSYFGSVNWTNIHPREIQELSERMLNAAKVPEIARRNYYRAFMKYIYGLPH